MAFPVAPRKDIDWKRLGMDVNNNINGHVESTFTVDIGKWTEPEFVQDPHIKIHGLAPALNYGQQAYEGLKASRRSDGNIVLFRPTDHADRLVASSRFICIPELPQEHFMKCVKLAVARNAEWVPPFDSGAQLYIRPLIFGSSGHLTVTPPAEYKFLVYVQPGTTYHGLQPLPACVIDEFDRAAPRGTGSAKLGGNYAPVIPHTLKAAAEGFHATLHLDAQTRTYVEEFSSSGFVGIKNHAGNVTMVVPDSKNIVPSITSDSCISIARSLGWVVEKRDIPWTECQFFDEVVAVGTAASLLPIRLLARPSTGEKFVYGETVGECTSKLRTALKDIMDGTVEDKFGWTQLVEDKDLL